MPTSTQWPTLDPASVLRAHSLANVGGIVHGFSTRIPAQENGGSDFNLGLSAGGNTKTVERNRAAFVRAVTGDDDGWTRVPLRQLHSDIIHIVKHAPSEALPGDGAVTNVPGLLLSILTADCLPVLVADTRKRAVGAFHAGWRGTLARIVEKGIGIMRREFSSDPADIRAAIGPCIHACCYEVDEEFRDKFASQFDYADKLFTEVFSSDPVREKYPLLFMNMRAPGHGAPPCRPHLDLVEANRRQLVAAGVPENAIDASPLCTACRTDLLYSHRAEKGKAGRMMAAIGIKPAE